MKQQPRFKVGDWVQLTVDSLEYYENDNWVGSLFKVSEVMLDGTMGGEFLYNLEDCESAFYEFELEPAD